MRKSQGRKRRETPGNPKTENVTSPDSRAVTQ
jgi:hypothetical protein